MADCDGRWEDRVLVETDESPFEEAFLQSFLAHQRGLYAYVLMLVPSVSDADDVFQEASIILWRKRRDFEIGTSFNAWASRVVFHAVQSFRAKQARHRRREVFDDALIERIAAEAAKMGHHLDARRAALDRCLEKLPARDRELLERRYAPGVTIRSLADTVGRPVGGMYKALKRIHDTVAACVERALQTQKEPA